MIGICNDGNIQRNFLYLDNYRIPNDSIFLKERVLQFGCFRKL